MCRYDLQSLMNRDFTVVNTSGIKYKFRVCGALTDNACRIETGAVYFLSIAYNYHYMMNLNFSHQIIILTYRNMQFKIQYIIGPS